MSVSGRRATAWLALMLGLSALGSPSSAAGPFKVVTSVAPLADLIKRIGGMDLVVAQLIPDGRDAHTFDPSPTAAAEFANADMMIFNGLGLEEPLMATAKTIERRGIPLVFLGDQTVPMAAEIVDATGHPNPHAWMSVAYAMRYVEMIRDALVAADPAHAAGYRRRAGELLAQLTSLDIAVTTAVRTIPAAHRKLVTYHDSWPYFARQYGMKVIAAIQPASYLEPSAREVAAIIDQVRAAEVPAVFGSEVFPSSVLETIGRETHTRYIDTLRDDVLPGPKGSATHSYVGMMIENVRTIVTALGGDPKALESVLL